MCASPHISNLLSQFVIHTEHHLLLIMSKPPMHVQEPSVRQQCSGILLQYILDYPLGAKRLQHHLQFLITNLSFEHESGRQASVDTMKVSRSIPAALEHAGHSARAASCLSHGQKVWCYDQGKITWHLCRNLDWLARVLVSCGIVLLQA